MKIKNLDNDSDPIKVHVEFTFEGQEKIKQTGFNELTVELKENEYHDIATILNKWRETVLNPKRGYVKK